MKKRNTIPAKCVFADPGAGYTPGFIYPLVRAFPPLDVFNAPDDTGRARVLLGRDGGFRLTRLRMAQPRAEFVTWEG